MGLEDRKLSHPILVQTEYGPRVLTHRCGDGFSFIMDNVEYAYDEVWPLSPLEVQAMLEATKETFATRF